MDAVTASIIRRNGPAKTIRTTAGSAPTSSNVWVTLVSITGRGTLFTVNGLVGGGVGNTWRVTIDGGTPMTITDSPVTVYPRNSAGPWAFLEVPFDTSLLIEYTQGSGSSFTGSATATWGDR
jgi:hypothetical protein